MNVLTRGERGQHLCVATQVRRDAQLDLRVVDGDEHVTGPARPERATDALAEIGSDGDVHEVRVGRRKPASRRACLTERRVDPPGQRIHQLRQRVDICRLELRQLPVLEDLGDDLVLLSQRLERVGVG